MKLLFLISNILSYTQQLVRDLETDFPILSRVYIYPFNSLSAERDERRSHGQRSRPFLRLC